MPEMGAAHRCAGKGEAMKPTYSPPILMDFSMPAAVQTCDVGSSPIGNCDTGMQAGESCGPGTMAAGSCAGGVSPNVLCVMGTYPNNPVCKAGGEVKT